MAVARPRTNRREQSAMKILLCMLVRNERECLEIMLPPDADVPGTDSGFDAMMAVDAQFYRRQRRAFWRNAGIETLRQTREGRGGACMEVMEKYPADAYLFFSPDGNEDVADIARFRPLLEGGAELVIASRMCTGAVNEEDGHWFRPRKAVVKPSISRRQQGFPQKRSLWPIPSTAFAPFAPLWRGNCNVDA